MAIENWEDEEEEVGCSEEGVKVYAALPSAGILHFGLEAKLRISL
jgi:hypothetical protein